MVNVSLLKMVSMRDTRPLWPADFAVIVAKLEDKERPSQTVPEVLAEASEWCEENGELGLAHAFDWLARWTLQPLDAGDRKPVEIADRHGWTEAKELPAALGFSVYGEPSTGFAGMVAALAVRLGEVSQLIA
jgi:hypothetical protein